MAKRFKMGNKMKRKSWDSSEIDQEAENKKMILIFIGLFFFMTLLVLFVWWMRNA